MDQLPLPVEVGEAITGYLRRGRPHTSARVKRPKFDAASF
jgi:hypothetical protein